VNIPDDKTLFSDADGLDDLRARLDRLPVEEPSPALREGFERMLAAAAREPRSPAWRPWMARAAAALLLGAVGFLGGYGYRGVKAAPEKDSSLMRQGRAELRVAGVMLTAQGDPVDPAPAEILLDLLDRDPSESVRLAAVDALYLYGRQGRVRERLAASMVRQTSPRVQIALVDLLGGIREQRALDALHALLASPATAPEVAQRVRLRLDAQKL